MRQLGPLAKTLVAVWLLVWLAGLAVYGHRLAHGQIGKHALLVTAPKDADGYPVLRGVRPTTGTLDRLVAGEPRPALGDRVLRVGERDLRGAGQLRFEALALDQTGPDLRVSLTLERDGERIETWVEAAREPVTWSGLPGAFWGALFGLILLFSRAARYRSARFLGAYCLLAALGSTVGSHPATGPSWLHYAWQGLRFVQVIAAPLAISGLLLFPDDARRGRWLLAWPWIFAVLGFVTQAFRDVLFPSPLTYQLSDGLKLLSIQIAALGAITWRFVHAGAIDRRRMKWFFCGVYLAALPPIGEGIERALDPGGSNVWPLMAALRIIPFAGLGLLIGMLRFNLFDVDRLISATTAYSAVGIALLAGLITVVPAAAGALSQTLGVSATLTQGALAMLAAGIAFPVAQRLRPQIERVLFPERHRVDQSMERLIDELAHCREPRELVVRGGERLVEVLRPESCVTYARSGTTYSPIFVRGRAGPPGFAETSPLVATLRQRTTPLAMERFLARGVASGLDAFDRAVFETLEAALILPIHHRTQGLVAIVCLGPKHSGDVYTSSDLALLAAFSAQLSSELLRFEQEELTRQAEALREGLRLYVPGAVQEQLARGGETTAGEREVSVLFVDIRGYTAFAQDRAASEIFSAVNRYTQTVSEIVLRNRGHVVEFNGDGMMAVFGAPAPLPGKEYQAVEAGLAIVEAMRALELRGPAGEPLSVGVGIASGPAFVGSVQAADRAIWTALGNTTNRAARFQGLTRELEAAIVLDAATHAASGAAAARFERRERIEIRGRREPEDLWVLPLR